MKTLSCSLFWLVFANNTTIERGDKIKTSL